MFERTASMLHQKIHIQNRNEAQVSAPIAISFLSFQEWLHLLEIQEPFFSENLQRYYSLQPLPILYKGIIPCYSKFIACILIKTISQKYISMIQYILPWNP